MSATDLPLRALTAVARRDGESIERGGMGHGTRAATQATSSHVTLYVLFLSALEIHGAGYTQPACLALTRVLLRISRRSQRFDDNEPRDSACRGSTEVGQG